MYCTRCPPRLGWIGYSCLYILPYIIYHRPCTLACSVGYYELKTTSSTVSWYSEGQINETPGPGIAQVRNVRQCRIITRMRSVPRTFWTNPLHVLVMAKSPSHGRHRACTASVALVVRSAVKHWKINAVPIGYLCCYVLPLVSCHLSFSQKKEAVIYPTVHVVDHISSM